MDPVVDETLVHLAPFLAPRASLAERMAAGKALREKVPRKQQGIWPAERRTTDPLAFLISQNAVRNQALVPVRMGRMLASPFAFLRGSAGIMAGDLASSPRTDTIVVACGDMHVSNFGLFGTAERNLVFAINDFDEVYHATWEWDVKRLATSAAVAARHLGGDAAHAREAAEATTRSYVRHIRRYSGMGYLQVWYDRIDEATILGLVPANLRKAAAGIFSKARARGHLRTLERLTEEIDGSKRLIEQRPILIRETHSTDGAPIMETLDQMLGSYIASLSEERRILLSRYRIVDVVRKIVGVGSVGTSCWVIMLTGQDQSDPLFLQVKEALPSVLASHFKGVGQIENQGHRIVLGQRMIQGSPDIFLGWGPTKGSSGRNFYVRQLADMKGGIDLIEGNRTGLDRLIRYCGLCGYALALAHAKSGQAAIITGYAGTSDALPDAIGQFAMAYAAQNEQDYELLENAVKTGRVPAVLGQ